MKTINFIIAPYKIRFQLKLSIPLSRYYFVLKEIHEVDMAGKKKQEIITFKVDESLSEALSGIQNRSEFIRSAISSALKNICPLCQGTGVMTPDQVKHWKEFERNHPVIECNDCQAMHLTCNAQNEIS